MYATVSACTILLVLKFAGGSSEVWRALVSLISCMFKISQYGAPLQINVLSVECYCVSHYTSYIPWHTQLRISCFCDVTPTHPCTVYTWQKRCVHVLSISFLCDVALTHPCTVYTWHKRCVHVLSISFLCNVTPTHLCTVYTWHKRCVRVLSISFLCDVTPTHLCTVYTWHKRCVHVLSISFLCDVTLTHPLCAHGRSCMYCCARQKSLLNSYPWASKSILNFHIPFSLRSILISLQFFK